MADLKRSTFSTTAGDFVSQIDNKTVVTTIVGTIGKDGENGIDGKDGVGGAVDTTVLSDLYLVCEDHSGSKYFQRFNTDGTKASKVTTINNTDEVPEVIDYLNAAENQQFDMFPIGDLNPGSNIRDFMFYRLVDGGASELLKSAIYSDLSHCVFLNIVCNEPDSSQLFVTYKDFLTLDFDTPTGMPQVVVGLNNISYAGINYKPSGIAPLNVDEGALIVAETVGSTFLTQDCSEL